MSKSTNTLLLVAGGIGLLYLLTKGNTSTASAGPLLNQGGNSYCPNAAACPSSFIACGLAPTVQSILSQF